MEEKTYIMVKPDGVQRGLVGRILQRFEDKGLRILGLKMMRPNPQLIKDHYVELKDKPFFSDLIDYIGSGPVVCICLIGRDAAALARTLIGATDPLKAANGTIRGDFGIVSGRNVVHGSDSPESALREILLWFKNDELVDTALKERVFPPPPICLVDV